MSDVETIKWYLTELANADGDDIESNDLEICGNDEAGVDGCFTEQITKIAEKSLTLIEEQQKQIDKLNKVVDLTEKYFSVLNHCSQGTEPVGQTEIVARIKQLRALAELKR